MFNLKRKVPNQWTKGVSLGYLVLKGPRVGFRGSERSEHGPTLLEFMKTLFYEAIRCGSSCQAGPSHVVVCQHDFRNVIA